MEVKIGIRDVAREVVLESEESPDAVAQQVADAVSAGSLLSLVDDHGRKVLVPGDRIGYIEIGVAESRKVGFGTL